VRTIVFTKCLEMYSRFSKIRHCNVCCANKSIYICECVDFFCDFHARYCPYENIRKARSEMQAFLCIHCFKDL